MKTFVETHDAAKVLLIATVVASPVLEGAVTAMERARGADRGARMRAVGSSFVETATLRTKDASEGDRGTKWILVGSTILAVALGWKAAKSFPGAAISGGWPLFAIGLALVWCGIGVRLWSVATLGRFFRRVVVIQSGHRVVTEGPYRFVRHPAYLGNLIATTGLGLVFANWVSLAILILVPLLGHLPRIRVEERALEGSLGDDYVRYAANTKRLVPAVW